MRSRSPSQCISLLEVSPSVPWLIQLLTAIPVLQALRVWSLYNRSRRVGYSLLALVAGEIIGTALARSLPTPVSTLFIFYYTGWNLIRENIGLIQRGFPVLELGRISVFGK